MTAIACFRVDVAALGERQGAIVPLVQKFTVAFLEQRWLRPRRFAHLLDTTFMLTDPRTDRLDIQELWVLSDNLQAHLFGASESGTVALLVFEGTQEAVMAFAAMSDKEAAAAVQNPSLLPFGGQLTRILPGSRDGADERSAPNPPELQIPRARRRLAAASLAGPKPAQPPIWEGVQGVYFAPRQVFYADMVTYVPHGARAHLSLADGPGHFPPEAADFDTECMAIATRILRQRTRGAPLYLPLSFTSLVRPSLRKAYQTLLADLPSGRRGELAATVYDVPRDPNVADLTEARAMLDPYISALDLRTEDPEFEIEKLPLGLVNSVTFIMPEGDRILRIAAMRRFAGRLSHYKQRRVWPAISNLRQRAEVEAATKAQIPFLTGPAICRPRATPSGGSEVPIDRLPHVEQGVDTSERRRRSARC